MNFDQKQFLNRLPPFFSAMFKEISAQGFTPVLVGGVVRDFLLTGDVGQDWDIELTHQTFAFNQHQWKDLGKTLGKLGRVTFLPYDIIRLEIDSFQMEFSPPRIETFLPEVNHHSNFTAEYNFQLPFEKAVLRRDFTINAIGIKVSSLKEAELLDPLEGVRHLREKVLHPAGPDFSKDPVRYLRSHRFAVRLGFTFSPELETLLGQMQASGFSSTYLWNEMQKSHHPVTFLERLLKEKTKHPELTLPLDEVDHLSFKELAQLVVLPAKHESWVIALEWLGTSSEQWRQYFNQNSDTMRRLARWTQNCKFFQTTYPETFHGEFEAVRDTQDFEKLFDWYFSTKQLMQKIPDLNLMKVIEEYLPEWIHLYRFEVVKDVKHIDPPYRAKYQVWNLCQRL